MYVYIYIYTYVYIHIYVYMYKYIFSSYIYRETMGSEGGVSSLGVQVSIDGGRGVIYLEMMKLKWAMLGLFPKYLGGYFASHEQTSAA